MLSLNYRDARPIHEQVREGLRRLVVTGAVAEGEPLPTAENLAARFAINPTAVRRAYEALEQEGYLIRGEEGEAPTAGKGLEPPARREELMKQFDDTVRELYFLGVSAGELAGRLEEIPGPDNGKKTGPARLTVTVKLGGKGRRRSNDRSAEGVQGL